MGRSRVATARPGRIGPRTLAQSITPSWGAAGSSTERLWMMNDAREITGGPAFEPNQRLEAKIGYGLGLRHAPGVLTPFTGMTLGEERTWRAGARWDLAPEIALGLETHASSTQEGDVDRSVMLRAQARF